jgi:hypothetical protein
MASVFKSRMRELSGGAFDEAQQGDKTFRKFLERYPAEVGLEAEETNLYVVRPSADRQPPATATAAATPPDQLLTQALKALLKEQPRVRASLLKQRLSEMSDGRFSETALGHENFRAFLESYPQLVELRQHDSTLFVAQPHKVASLDPPHIIYRRALKKQGLRVIPAEVRLPLLTELVGLLPPVSGKIRWQELVETLKERYDLAQPDPVSKSMINDLLRLTQRANLVEALPADSLVTAPVYWRVSGERPFQEAVMRCDVAYMRALSESNDPLDLEEAALALYDDTSRARYLKVILKRIDAT